MVQTKVFRVFVSSTFSDMADERNALHKNVYPRLKDLCAAHDARFQVIDLRWGISDEAGINQQTMNVCLSEVKRCQDLTLRPNFILLLGDRYGWQPLPYEIEHSEFEDLLLQIKDASSVSMLREWYRLDENALPPTMILQPRQGEFVDPQIWSPVERHLQRILEAASHYLTPEKRIKYATSATEQEIQQGVFEANQPTKSAYCFFRSIRNLPKSVLAKGYVDLDENNEWDQTVDTKLNNLKQRLRDQLPDNCFNFETEWVDGKPTYTYLEAFCDAVYNQLSQAIIEEISTHQQVTNRWDDETAKHLLFAKNHTQNFVGRTEIVTKLDKYLNHPTHKPLVVHGDSGIGKTALMARMMVHVTELYPKVALICRFIGATASSSDIRSLLEGICHQIAQQLESEIAIPSDYRDLVTTLKNLMDQASPEQPLVLIIDALDQLLPLHEALELRWLPFKLPEHVFLICSTLPGDELEILRENLDPSDFAEINTMPISEGKELLRYWLKSVKRTLQPNQEQMVLQAFEQTGLPLYLRLAFEEARLWKSYSSEIRLHASISKIIQDNLFRRLEDGANHGKMLCSHVLAYFTAARQGLTEDELLDLLAQDDDYWADLQSHSAAHQHVLPNRQIPTVIWSRLFYDLSPYLAERTVGGTTILDFYHHQLWKAAAQRYLQDSVRQTFHKRMAHYFAEIALYFGNGVIPNQRKLAELPYQLFNAGLYSEMVSLLTDTREWMDAQFAATQGDTAFREDLEVALSIYKDPLDAQQQLEFVRTFTAWQLVHARANAYNTDDLKTLVWLGREGEALHAARMRISIAPEILYKGLITIFDALKAYNRTDMMLLNEIHNEVQQIEDDNIWEPALIKIALKYAENGDIDFAKNLIYMIPPGRERLEALIAFAKVIAPANEGAAENVLYEVEHDVSVIQSDWKRNRVLRAFVLVCGILGKTEQAEVAIQSMSISVEKSEALCNLAITTLKTNPLHSKQYFNEALTVARAVSDAKSRSILLSQIGMALAQSKDPRATSVLLEASASLDEIQNKYARFDAENKLTIALLIDSNSEEIELIRKILSDNRPSSSKAALLIELANVGYLSQAKSLATEFKISTAQAKFVALDVEAGRIDEALALAQFISSKQDRAQALSRIAAGMAKAKNPEATKLFAEATTLARALPDPSEENHALEMLVISLAQTGDFDVAKIILDQKLTGDKSYAQLNLVDALAQRGFLQEAEDLVRTISDLRWQSIALAAIGKALNLTDINQADALFNEAMQLIDEIQTQNHQDLARRRLVITLAECQRFESAEQCAGLIDEIEWKAIALSDIASRMAKIDGDRAEKLFNEIDSLLHSVNHHAKQADILLALTEAYARSGKYEVAETYARSAGDDEGRLTALSKLALMLTQAQDSKAKQIFAEVIEQTPKVLPSGLNYYVRQSIMDDLVRANRIADGLRLLGPRPIDEFIRLLISCSIMFESTQVPFSHTLIQQVCKIAGWERPDWLQVSAIFDMNKTR